MSDPAPQPQGQSIVLGPDGGRVVALGEAAAVTLKAVSDETGGTMSAYECVVPPATAGPPEHFHRSWDEAFYVLAGEMTFLVGDQTQKALAGSFVFIPRGVLHTFWNESDAPAKQLTVFTPAGIEDYFDAVSQVIAGGGDDSLEGAIALMEQHDMVVPANTREAYGALQPRRSMP
jgi:quercetin dioxygenase-like cupin family protein